MADIFGTLLDIGKKGVTYVLNTATAGGASVPTASTQWQGPTPIIQPDTSGFQFRDALDKAAQDLIDRLRGAARDSVKAVAGGAADALEDTDTFRRNKRLATFGFVGVGLLALTGIALAVRAGR